MPGVRRVFFLPLISGCLVLEKAAAALQLELPLALVPHKASLQRGRGLVTWWVELVYSEKYTHIIISYR